MHVFRPPPHRNRGQRWIPSAPDPIKIITMSAAGSTVASLTLKRELALTLTTAGSTAVAASLKREIALSFSPAGITAAVMSLTIQVSLASVALLGKWARRRYGRG